MELVQIEDIQFRVDLADIGGFDWYDFPGVTIDAELFEVLEVADPLMSDRYWLWNTAIRLGENTLDALYRPEPSSTYLIAEYEVEYAGRVVVKLGNIDWDSISGDSPVGFYSINDKEVYSE
jgi:hypothetical protein